MSKVFATGSATNMVLTAMRARVGAAAPTVARAPAAPAPSAVAPQ